MFQRNDDHRQRGVFDGTNLLPEKLRERLKGSWADVFYREVFCRIDEEIFADLYGEGPSRPNVPVNVLVALEILKSEFGWSDRELYEELCFDLQVRHAVGMTDLNEEVFHVRTLYNFRKRVREHAEETGENLFREVFEQVTDRQLKAVGAQTEKQRMDSTQVLSNVAQQSRLELITDVQVAPNATDDGELLKRSLQDQSERSGAPKQMTTDGGFTGPTAEEACEAHQTELRPTRIRGGQGDPDRLGWEDYEWMLDEEGRSTGVVCPKGEKGTVDPGEAEGRLIARFDPGTCEGCPLLGGACRVEERRGRPTLYVSERSVEVARMRQGTKEEDRSLRAPVEATMRSLKRGLGGDKLPTRGLGRAKMVIYGAALMVNVRRLCRYREKKRAEDRSAGEKVLFLAFLLALGTAWRKGAAWRKIRRWRGKGPRRGSRFG